MRPDTAAREGPMKSRIPRKPRTPATPPPLGDKSGVKSSPGPQPTLRYGDQFGDYVITGFAGKGATSFVYQARRGDDFQKVAVKVLHPHLLADPAKRRKFYQEARIMMRMRHANVVNFREILELDGHLAYVMEYIDGPTLEDWMRTRAKSASQLELACLFSDILRGLSHAHRHGVVHRDIKPANILIATHDGRLVAKVIDFGLARFADQPLSAQERSKIAGTAAYISPEEVSDPDSVGQSSDIYSLGVMLYEAACGQRPFAEEDPRALLDAHANHVPQTPREVSPALSPEFENVTLRTRSRRPDSRFDSAPEIIQAHPGCQSGGDARRDDATRPGERRHHRVVARHARTERPQPTYRHAALSDDVHARDVCGARQHKFVQGSGRPAVPGASPESRPRPRLPTSAWLISTFK